MPRYQYACPDCGNEFEATQKFTDKPIKKCPTCGKRSVYRVVGQVAVAFKGTGFYINDSKSSDTKKAAKPKPEEKPSTEATTAESTTTESKDNKDAAKVETKTETKEAPKTEAKEPKKEKKAKSGE